MSSSSPFDSGGTQEEILSGLSHIARSPMKLGNIIKVSQTSPQGEVLAESCEQKHWGKAVAGGQAKLAWFSRYQVLHDSAESDPALRDTRKVVCAAGAESTSLYAQLQC